MGFGNAVGSHRPPFVVIVSQPELGDVVPALVVRHLLGRKVRVVIDDGLALRRFMKKHSCGFGEEKEVVVEIGSSHVGRLEEDGRGGK